MNVAESEFAPLLPPSDIGQSDHAVQFYESDDYLLESVRAYAAVGLVTGEVCLVVATSEHRAGLEKRLADGGLDMVAIAERGQYVALDASSLLERIAPGGAPDAERFAAVLADIIETAAGGRRLRIFGEMVALLCCEGKHQEAIQLESLWNGLRERHGFSLFCGYPLQSLGKESLTELHRSICDEHSHVIPAESYHAVADAGERLRVIAELQQKAESLQAEVEERKAAEAALQQSLRLRDEFLASISHDLRTPITVLQGQAQLLRRRALRDTLDQNAILLAAEQIEGRSRSMAALIDELLDLTRLRAGEDLPLERTRLDLVQLIQEVAAERQEYGDGHEVLVLAQPVNAGWWDEQRLRRVFENLIGNAVKYSPAGTQVTVRIIAAAVGKVTVVVEDHGLGIPAADLPHIFEPFYRAANADRRTSGMGIGLAGARQIVELHGGRIGMESTEGKGSAVTVELPLEPGRGEA